MSSTLEALLDDRAPRDGRIQIDGFAADGRWRAVVALFSGPQVVREDVTPSAALRAALMEQERLSRQSRPQGDQLDIEDWIAGDDFEALL